MRLTGVAFNSCARIGDWQAKGLARGLELLCAISRQEVFSSRLTRMTDHSPTLLCCDTPCLMPALLVRLYRPPLGVLPFGDRDG